MVFFEQYPRGGRQWVGLAKQQGRPQGDSCSLVKNFLTLGSTKLSCTWFTKTFLHWVHQNFLTLKVTALWMKSEHFLSLGFPQSNSCLLRQKVYHKVMVLWLKMLKTCCVLGWFARNHKGKTILSVVL